MIEQADQNQNMEKRQAVLFDRVGSMEYYLRNGIKTQVLHDISFEVKAGETWFISGQLAFEMRLLLEIAANARPYETGRCVLNDRGMMRKKRVILPHVFYIGGTNMMFENMNVLEYLMFVTQKEQDHPVIRQRRLFEQLKAMGLSYLSLTLIGKLNPAERSVIILLAATHTESNIIIWNLPRLSYTDMLIGAAAQICEDLRVQGKAVLFSTTDYALADGIATHILLLKHGTAVYAGEKDSFCRKWDRLILTIVGADAARYAEVFQKTAPGYHYRVEGNVLKVYDPECKAKDATLFYGIVAVHRLSPDKIEQNSPNVGNAVGAAIRSDDI